jgi:hypothetical protein
MIEARSSGAIRFSDPDLRWMSVVGLEDGFGGSFRSLVVSGSMRLAVDCGPQGVCKYHVSLYGSHSS